MAVPDPVPTEEQLVDVGDIMMIAPSNVLAFLSVHEDQLIANAAWAQTLIDLEVWPNIRDESGDVAQVDSIRFFEMAGIRTRLAFRNRIRRRFGMSPLLDESCGAPVASFGGSIRIQSDW